MKFRMTKIQFDTIRRLACAYGHEWAKGLDFAEIWPRNAKPGDATTTRGDVYRANSAYADLVQLHDRIERGYVPTCAEIESVTELLFGDSHYPTTCYVALDHETCTGRTRWSVEADGEVRFEFYSDPPMFGTDPPKRLLCRARVWTSKVGQRVAMVDAIVPLAQWGDDHRRRIISAFVAAGADEREAERALDATAFGGKRVCRFDLAAEHAALVSAA